MLTRLKSVLPGLLVLVVACLWANGAAAGLLAPREHNRLIGELEKRPMVFFVAKGPTDSCGRGCNEWIAAVGRFEVDTPQRFREFLEKLNGRTLPIFFYSRGGWGKAGVEIGKMLRERRMTASVGQTETKQCRVFDKKDAGCQGLIERGESIPARLVTKNGQCHSACVLAFAGGSSRRVAAGAIIGVHSPRLDNSSQKQPQLLAGKKSADSKVEMGQVLQATRWHYLAMGLDPALADFSARTPFERIHILDRDELARFGLETHDKSFETSWTTFDFVNRQFGVAKSVTRRTRTEPAEHLTTQFQFYCTLEGRAFFGYRREIALSSDQPTTTIHVAFDDRPVSFQSKIPQPGLETGLYFLRDKTTIVNVATAKIIAMTEKTKGDDEVLLETKLSTAGLGAALGEFAKRCVPLPLAVKPAISPVKTLPLTPTTSPEKPSIWPAVPQDLTPSGLGVVPR